MNMPSQLRCKISNKSVMHKSPLQLHLLEYITTSSVVRDSTRGICQMFSASVVYHYNPTSNRNKALGISLLRLVVYHYNPTSNRNSITQQAKNLGVVYHYNPTSNRNWGIRIHKPLNVVYHYNPTSNRNSAHGVA